MVDLETTGTFPDVNAILQIAAVIFDWKTGAIGPAFSINLEMPPTRYWDEGCRDWWRKQDSAVFEKVIDNPTSPALAMRTFTDWVRANTGVIEQPRLWAKPASFEGPFIASYCHQFEVRNPFHYRDTIDLQSFIRGMRNDPSAPAFDKEVPMIGDAHLALDDVYHQIAVALTAKLNFAKETPLVGN